MSFAVEARKVRDASSPYGARVMALARCIELYSPIGFQATWAFLEARSGDLRADPNALVRALEEIENSRRRRGEEEREYSKRRRAAKRTGRRHPPRHETTPSSPARWHLAPQEAATFVLHWYRRRHAATGWAAGETAQRVYQLLDHAIGTNDREAQIAALTEARDLLAPRQTIGHYQTDPASYFDARRLESLRQHVRVVLGLY